MMMKKGTDGRRKDKHRHTHNNDPNRGANIPNRMHSLSPSLSLSILWVVCTFPQNRFLSSVKGATNFNNPTQYESERKEEIGKCVRHTFEGFEGSWERERESIDNMCVAVIVATNRVERRWRLLLLLGDKSTVQYRILDCCYKLCHNENLRTCVCLFNYVIYESRCFFRSKVYRKES